MSRSRRKYPVITEQQGHPHTRFWKRLASKAARKVILSSGGSYKKTFDSWNICDWVSRGWSKGRYYRLPLNDYHWWKK